MSKTARFQALAILKRCRLQGGFSDSMLSELLDESDYSKKDRALISKLCYGVLQNALLLDFYIDAFLDGKKKLEPMVRDILRLSLYQILFLERIPDHAAVNVGVQLCKDSGLERASGLVNAVLRRAAGSRGSLPEIPRGNIQSYLSIKYSTPASLVAEFISEFGADFAEAMLKAYNTEPPLTVQVNTLKTSPRELLSLLEKEGVLCERHGFLENALNLSPSGALTELEAFKKGLFFVQDAAAAMAVAAAAPLAGQRVLDACAAPGGKSFSCAVRMENRGSICACDIAEKKLERITGGARALGIDIISTEQNDAALPRRGFENAFDCVIADVPCSGLGVIRKKPDIRYKSLEEAAALPGLQKKILDNLSDFVKPGGKLLYATCTVLRRENEDVVNEFLSRHSEFSPESFVLPEPVGGAESGMITLFPHVHGTDGFFICVLRKAGSE